MSATVLIGQAPVNLGPLTTVFTPPAACTAAVGAIDGGLLGIGLLPGAVNDVAFLGQACSRGRGVDATTCWPPTSSGAVAKSAPLNGWGFYSPGVNCPAGYATACSATGGAGGSSGWPVQFQLLDGETAVGCCPDGYGCGNINGQTCIMIATSTTVPTVTCDGSRTGSVAVQTVPDVAASVTAFSLFAPMIQINWQASDRPETTERQSGPTRTGTAGRPTITSGTQTIDPNAASGIPTLELDDSPAPTPGGEGNEDAGGQSGPSNDTEQKEAESEGNGGLATATKVGLGIAGGVGALAILVAAIMFVWRRRKHQDEEQELDRLYAMKHSNNSSSDLTGYGKDGGQGWYPGQRQVPTKLMPTAYPYRGVGASELEAPPSPYYRPYRP